MASTTYNITRVADGVGGYELYDARVFKGAVDVTLNFSFTVDTATVVKLKLVVGDRPPQLFQGEHIPTSVNFTLNPDANEYIKLHQVMFAIVYDNFQSVDFVLPIHVAQPSYYTDFEGFRVVGAQFIDTEATGDVFATIQANSNIYHMLIHANETVVATTTAASIDILAATLSASIVTPPIETSLNEIIEVQT